MVKYYIGDTTIPGLYGADGSIDWSRTTKMTPIKNQGSCGSCWAFASSAVLESMISIQRNTAVKSLSEQELVDCTIFAKGCDGGNFFPAWD